MLFKKPDHIPSSEVTPEHVYVNRRQSLAAAALGTGASLLPRSACAAGKYDTDEKQSPLNVVTTYNNYYEFGTGKNEPAITIGGFKTRPWTVAVEGLVKRISEICVGSRVRIAIFPVA
jgi:sulfoxide reductase catalytic subunit YedY